MSIVGYQKKGINKAQKSTIFDTYEEAKHYQAEYGGKISIVRKYEEILEKVEDPLDFGLDDPNMVINKKIILKMFKKYFVLNIKDQTDLRN